MTRGARISVDAETTALSVFPVNVFDGMETSTGNMLGRLVDLLQGFLVCCCAVTVPNMRCSWSG